MNFGILNILLSLSMIKMVAVSLTNCTSILPCTNVTEKYSVLSMISSSVMLNEMQFGLEEDVRSNNRLEISISVNMRVWKTHTISNIYGKKIQVLIVLHIIILSIK